MDKFRVIYLTDNISGLQSYSFYRKHTNKPDGNFMVIVFYLTPRWLNFDKYDYKVVDIVVNGLKSGLHDWKGYCSSERLLMSYS